MNGIAVTDHYTTHVAGKTVNKMGGSMITTGFDNRDLSVHARLTHPLLEPRRVPRAGEKNPRAEA